MTRSKVVRKKAKQLVQQVQSFGPLLLRHNGDNRLLQLCRIAVAIKLPLQYKLLSNDRREGIILLWVHGQEEMADKLASKYRQRLPYSQRVVIVEA